MPRKASYATLHATGVTPYCDLSLNGLTVKEAIAATKKYVKEHNLGRVKVNYRLRDAIFSVASATGANRSRFTTRTTCLT